MKRPPRKHMPLKVKLAAALFCLGLDPDDVDWHHEPPLGLRPIDPITGDTDPPANNPKHIIPMARAGHKARTPADVTAIAKVKRVSRKHEAFRQRLLAAEPHPEGKKRAWPKRKMCGRAKTACSAQKKRV